MKYAKIGIALFILVLAVILVFQNSNQVQISFLFWDAKLPLFVFSGLLLLAGLLAGVLGGWFLSNRLRKKKEKPETMEKEE